jgi:acyl carrier protein phosphodiesterase
MNFLAHAWLSFGDVELLAGNMTADHVKGQKALESLPAGIADGIRLHRHIDAFSDTHPAVARAKVWFREDYHLFAGPILDVIWDHYLANDPAIFESKEDLSAFCEKTYQQLEETNSWHPEVFQRYFPYMRRDNWLLGYRNLKGIERALRGLERRSAEIPPTDKAYEIFIGRYYQLGQCYYELMDDLRAYVKNEIAARS